MDELRCPKQELDAGRGGFIKSFAQRGTRQWIRWLISWLAPLNMLLAAAGFCQAQQTINTNKRIVISVDRFLLLTEGENFFLQSTAADRKRTQIPREWLIPPRQERDEEDAPVSSLHYDQHVTSFPIGNAEYGIRISSYDMMTEGSLQEVAGRDVFLIYDPSGKVRPGNVDFDITKERYWDDGCWYAKMTHFLVSDVNRDGLADIGIVKEEIGCPKGEDAWEGDSYEQHPVHWYVYSHEGWTREEYDSGWPDSFVELPLVGITSSPVDFVGYFLWHTYDPAHWKTAPRYLPTYRKKLMAERRRPESAKQILEKHSPSGSPQP